MAKPLPAGVAYNLGCSPQDAVVRSGSEVRINYNVPPCEVYPNGDTDVVEGMFVGVAMDLIEGDPVLLFVDELGNGSVGLSSITHIQRLRRHNV